MAPVTFGSASPEGLYRQNFSGIIILMTTTRLAKAAGIVLLLLALGAGLALLQGTTLQVSIVLSSGLDLGLRLDVLATVLLGFVATLIWLIASYAQKNLAGQAQVARFGIWLAVAAAVLVILVAGASLVVIAIGWTLSGLALTQLVSHSGTQDAVRAARFMRRRLWLSDAFL